MLALLVLSACASRPDAVASTAEAPSPWESTYLRDHPLVGRIVDAASGQEVAEAELVARLRAVEVVLLGEKHDNPDHHRLQARIVGALASSQHAVAFEMLDSDDPVSGYADAASLAEGVGWAESGWPDFALYAPVFEATLEAGATVLAASPPPAAVQAAMGRAAAPVDIPPAVEARRAVPLSEAEQRALLAELEASHCGMMTDPAVLGRLADAQLLKDAWMASALEGWAGPAILVAGAGHTRTDRGVPARLERPSLTVHLVEVHEEILSSRHATESLPPADFIWFTPVFDPSDPCAAFR